MVSSFQIWLRKQQFDLSSFIQFFLFSFLLLFIFLFFFSFPYSFSIFLFLFPFFLFFYLSFSNTIICSFTTLIHVFHSQISSTSSIHAFSRPTIQVLKTLLSIFTSREQFILSKKYLKRDRMMMIVTMMMVMMVVVLIMMMVMTMRMVMMMVVKIMVMMMVMIIGRWWAMWCSTMRFRLSWK